MNKEQIKIATQAVHEELLNKLCDKGNNYWQPRHMRKLFKLACDTIGKTVEEADQERWEAGYPNNPETDLYSAVRRELVEIIRLCGRTVRSL